jgi:dedicator of cytokinesis protein 3
MVQQWEWILTGEVFESTFAPEIAIFMPSQPLLVLNPSPTPSWPHRSPQPTAGFAPQPQKTGGPLLANGAANEEVKILQPVTLRQGRGARLSFLGGRKKDAKENTPPVPQINGDNHAHEDEGSNLSHSRSTGKENGNRRSFFRGHSSSESNTVGARSAGYTNGAEMSPATIGGGRVDQSMDWVTDSGAARESTDATAVDKERTLSSSEHGSSTVGGIQSLGSVRKRLSILRLGKKSSKGNGLMGSLDEE